MRRRDFIKNSLVTTTGMILFPPLTKAYSHGLGLFLSELEKSFINPPLSARPWCFWMWMNGNITKEGITLDLEAMKRMGIGGVINFNSAVGIPRGPVDYASDEWMEATAHAVREAERLGIEMTIHNSPGYSGAGGPWVTPEMSMQQLVWTEVLVTSAVNEEIRIKLTKPYAKQNYYQNAFIIAYPSLPVEKALMKDKLVKVWVNGKEVDRTIISDGNPETKVRLESGTGASSTLTDNYDINSGTVQSSTEETKAAVQASLTLQFAEPFEARAIAITRKPEVPRDLFDGPRDHPPILRLEYSDDGIMFKPIGTIRTPELRAMDTPATLSFEGVRSSYYRLLASSPTWISDVELYNGPRLGGWPGKTGYTHGDSGGQTPTVSKEMTINPSQVINISDKIDNDGNLRWLPPTAGNWTILRIGHTTTGEEPAAHPDAGKGLEIDKFRKEALDFHFAQFLDRFLSRIQPNIGKSFKGITTDSWEAGKQNWTISFPAEFKKRRSYEIVQWMPAFTGRIVGSVDETEKFLWDVRKVQAELLAENFYGYFAEQCRKRGLAFSAEPYGDGNFDSLEAGKYLDVPMSEFWTRYIYGGDVTSKQAASLAHIYGRPIVAAEAYTAMPATSKWTDYPYSLKAEGDYFFSLGVNRLTFHTFVHQPYTTGKPGMTMGPFGMHIDRNNSWTEQAYGWTDYLRRTQYILQQGLFIADICYFKGDTPESGIPNIYAWLPNGYKGDVIGADALHSRFKIKEGKIVLPDGMSYRICVMAPLHAIEMTTLKRLMQLVKDGMILTVTSRPDKALGHKYNDAEIKSLIAEFYGDMDGKTVTSNNYGQGKLYWGIPLIELFTKINVSPDFIYTSQHNNAAIHYTHKQLEYTHFYFVTNHKRNEETIVASFRITGLQPEIWNGETGEYFDAPLFDFVDDRTVLPMTLSPAGSVFIVFRKKNKRKYISLEKDGYVLFTTNAFNSSGQGIYKEVQNTFSVVLWAKPDTFAHPGKSMIFHPPEGAILYGNGHAAIGMGVGQNGIRLYERTLGGAREALYINQALQGWTHLAVIYQQGKPSVFINAKLIEEGKTSSFVVHPGLNTPPTDEQYASFFEGNFTIPVLINKALSPGEVRNLFLKGLPAPQLPSVRFLPAKNNKTALIAFNDGNYIFKGDEEARIQIKGCHQSVIDGPWMVQFPKQKGLPREIELPQLMSLHQHPDFNVKHFSGTATYNKMINIASDKRLPHKRIFLHLGRVEIIAEIRINDKKAGILWKEPFIIDITDIVRTGMNKIQIAVTTLWPNRLIGDEYLPAENIYTKDNNIVKLPEWFVKNNPKPGERDTFSTWHTYDKNSPLLEAGLLGPVHLLIAIENQLNNL